MSAPELIEVAPAVHDGERLASCLDLLRQLGAETLPHSGRTFIEHLVGTYELLKSWACDEDVALAGLFHSVYGTNAFQQSCLPFDQRDRLRTLIGNRAEQLAYLFCSIERPKAFLPALKTRKLLNRFSSAQITVELSTLRDLIAIECANLIEQRDGKAFLSTLMAAPATGRLGLPVLLKTAVNQYKQNIGAASYLQHAPTNAASLSSEPTLPGAQSHAGASTLRVANESDVVELVYLARELHADSRWQWTYFDKSRTASQIRDWLADANAILMVAQKGQDIVGFAAGRLEPLPFVSSKALRVQFVYVQHRHRGVLALRLLHRLSAWGKQKRAAELRLDDEFGVNIERNAKLFKRLGLTTSGSSASLWL